MTPAEQPALPMVSGAVHYFRVHPQLWRDRLERCRAMGLTTIETYVAWNFHEPRQGCRDFTDWRDLEAFIRLVADLGMTAIVRPGPYICAEWDLGGLPAWLLRDVREAGELRSMHPAYLSAVDDWFDDVIPRIADLQVTRGGPVVAVQVENEYGSYGSDSVYLAYLRAGLLARGIDVPLFTSDGPEPLMLAGGTIEGVWATGNFGSQAAENLRVLREFGTNGPLMCMEFWNGWFDHWGEERHTRDPADAAQVLADLLEAGASVNLYMAHGGTNFGSYAGANLDGDRYQPTVTSYDYDAPIGEAGELTEKFYRFRDVITASTGVLPPPAPETPRRLRARAVEVVTGGSLLPRLRATTRLNAGPLPVTMENLGESDGVLHYRGRLAGPLENVALLVGEVHDRAYVLLDGGPIAVVDRNEPRAITLSTPVGGADLEIVVESFGRVNYGTAAPDRKGLLGPVRLGHQLVHRWTTRHLSFDEIAALPVEEVDGEGLPWLGHASVRIDRPADGFIATPEWHSGVLWINGFCLGRYRGDGPQRTLYAPAPLWRPGENEIKVLEFQRRGDRLEILDSSRLA